MSEPRHAMVFICDDGLVWLHMVPEAEGDDDRSPAAAKTYGPFGTVFEARRFADDNFQNTGFVIPLYEPHKEVDDRIDMHYVVDRLEDIMGNYDPSAPEIADLKYIYKRLDDFKRECIYNLGVNQRIKYHG